MNTTQSNFDVAVGCEHRPSRIELPLNLAQSVDEEVIAQWASEAVELHLTVYPTDEARVHELPELRTILTTKLLVFCYTTGRFESGAICREFEAKGKLAALFDFNNYDWIELMHFRRQNRNRLCSSLAIVLQRIWQRSSGLTTARTPSSSWFLREAEERLRFASLWDSVALDD